MKLENLPAFFVTNGTSRRVVGVRCQKCGDTQVGSDKPICPPTLIARHFSKAGWKMYRDGIAATCPKCQLEAAAETRELDESAALVELERQRATEERRLAAKNSQPKDDMTQPTKETLRAQARLHHLLAEHFTVEGDLGAYDKDWSDQRVATETGLALAEVVRVRDAAYGKLADPRIVALTKEIEDVGRKFAADVSELRTMFETTTSEHEAQLAALGRQLAELQGRRA